MVNSQHMLSREMDLDHPSAARIYDAFLGGSHNFGVDRDFVDHAEQALPGITEMYRQNRAFLWRAVQYLVAKGVRQFLDLGSGIPTIGHVHEVARRGTSEFRVVYVENEPLTVAHSRPLLAAEPQVEIIRADCRDMDSVLRAPETIELLDLDRPVALLMSAVLHFLPDSDDPPALVRAYRDALAPGSYLLISHVTGDEDPLSTRTLEGLYTTSADPLVARSKARIGALFGDFPLIEPGPRMLGDWRPERGEHTTPPRYKILYGGMARKPSPRPNGDSRAKCRP